MSALKWLNPSLATLTPYEPGRPIEDVAREHGLAPDEICKLASNENPLGTSPKAKQAMCEKLDDCFLYPDGGAFYLREKLALKYNALREQVILGAGSNEILEFIGHCFFAPDRSIVVSAHAFVIYKLIATVFGTEIRETPAAGLGHDMDAMAEAVRENTSVVFICNPNNPTGTIVDETATDRFMDAVPEDTLVVFDEAYAEIALDTMPDTLKYVREGRNCVVLRTFSKAYGLAGLRIGYGIGPQPIINALQKARQPFNVSRIAQEAAFAALDDHEFINQSRTLFADSKQYFEKEFTRLGFEFQPSIANFVLVKVGDAAQVADKLMKKGMIVRPMAGYGLPAYIRISYGTPSQNKQAVKALAETVNPQTLTR